MLKRLRALFKKPPLTVQDQSQGNEQVPHGIFNLPPDWMPIDSVIDSTQIPGTDSGVGTAARVIETDRQERIEFNQRRGIRTGCRHLVYSADQIAGSCPLCEMICFEMVSQGLMTKSQADERSLYCVQCASYCSGCFISICAAHTQLLPGPDGRFLPVCTVCYEKLTKKSLIVKAISFIIGA